MEFDYHYVYGMEDELGAAFGALYLVYSLLSFGLSIAAYVLSCMGLYTIAKRRGISKPWLAWIPLVNVWILGSISDQYRYVTKGQIRNKRKILLGLEIGLFALLFAMFFGLVVAGLAGEGLVAAGAAILLVMLVSLLAIVVVALVYTVFYYMAMYDVYTSVNPPYNVVFLVLSILFRITEPFFLFFNRKKDGGMPPRCDIHTPPAAQPDPVYLPPQQPIQEPWENVTEE